MTTSMLSGWIPVLTAFVIWFVHFLACWVAVEIWPAEPLANRLAWGFTALALAAMAVFHAGVRAAAAAGDLEGWNRRFADGAAAIATVSILFSAVPSVVFVR